MYTRTYQAEEEKITVPENYDGNAFREDRECESYSPPDVNTSQNTEAESKCNKTQESASEAYEECSSAPKKKAESSGILGSIFKVGSEKSSFLDSLPFVKNGIFDIGTEEILIVAVAVFLLLSKSGDKECAIMLLLLLFVK
jgi:hypothetical protein